MQILNLLAAAIVLGGGVRAINHMCPGTALPIRATWLLLTIGAAAVLLAGLAGGRPTWPDLALHWGIAALVCAGPRGLTFCSTGDKS
jgi:hypothetical protein